MRTGKSKHLYTEIWTSLRPIIINQVKKDGVTSISLNSNNFFHAGDRKSYSMKIEFEDGRLVKCTNSAVARDLVEVLERSSEFMHLCAGKSVVVRLSSKFVLQIEIHTKAKDS